MTAKRKCKYGRRAKGKCPTKKQASRRRGRAATRRVRKVKPRKLSPAALRQLHAKNDRAEKALQARLKARGYVFDIDR